MSVFTGIAALQPWLDVVRGAIFDLCVQIRTCAAWGLTRLALRCDLDTVAFLVDETTDDRLRASDAAWDHFVDTSNMDLVDIAERDTDPCLPPSPKVAPGFTAIAHDATFPIPDAPPLAPVGKQVTNLIGRMLWSVDHRSEGWEEELAMLVADLALVTGPERVDRAARQITGQTTKAFTRPPSTVAGMTTLPDLKRFDVLDEIDLMDLGGLEEDEPPDDGCMARGS